MHSSCAFLSKMLSKLSIINLFKRDASNWLCVDDFRGAGHGFILSKINIVKIIVTIETSKETGKSKKNMLFLQ